MIGKIGKLSIVLLCTLLSWGLANLAQAATIKVIWKLEHGEALYITGSSEALGDWKTAHRLTIQGDRTWIYNSPSLPKGEQFKLLKAAHSLGERMEISEHFTWENGDDRTASGSSMLIYYIVFGQADQGRMDMFKEMIGAKEASDFSFDHYRSDENTLFGRYLMIKNRDFVPMVEVLKGNKTLETISIGGPQRRGATFSQEGTDGMAPLAEALKYNDTLKSISFHIGSESARKELSEALADALKYNKTITSVRLVMGGGYTTNFELVEYVDQFTPMIENEIKMNRQIQAWKRLMPKAILMLNASGNDYGLNGDGDSTLAVIPKDVLLKVLHFLGEIEVQEEFAEK